MSKDKDNKRNQSSEKLPEFDAKLDRRWTKGAKGAARGKTDSTNDTDFGKINNSHKTR